MRLFLIRFFSIALSLFCVQINDVAWPPHVHGLQGGAADNDSALRHADQIQRSGDEIPPCGNVCTETSVTCMKKGMLGLLFYSYSLCSGYCCPTWHKHSNTARIARRANDRERREERTTNGSRVGDLKVDSAIDGLLHLRELDGEGRPLREVQRDDVHFHGGAAGAEDLLVRGLHGDEVVRGDCSVVGALSARE